MLAAARLGRAGLALLLLAYPGAVVHHRLALARQLGQACVDVGDALHHDLVQLRQRQAAAAVGGQPLANLAQRKADGAR